MVLNYDVHDGDDGNDDNDDDDDDDYDDFNDEKISPTAKECSLEKLLILFQYFSAIYRKIFNLRRVQSQPKVRFGECFNYFLMKQESLKNELN